MELNANQGARGYEANSPPPPPKYSRLQNLVMRSREWLCGGGGEGGGVVGYVRQLNDLLCVWVETSICEAVLCSTLV